MRTEAFSQLTSTALEGRGNRGGAEGHGEAKSSDQPTTGFTLLVCTGCDGLQSRGSQCFPTNLKVRRVCVTPLRSQNGSQGVLDLTHLPFILDIKKIIFMMMENIASATVVNVDI